MKTVYTTGDQRTESVSYRKGERERFEFGNVVLLKQHEGLMSRLQFRRIDSVGGTTDWDCCCLPAIWWGRGPLLQVFAPIRMTVTLFYSTVSAVDRETLLHSES
jgi:hypothetical protein